MLDIQINEQQAKAMLVQKIEETIKNFDAEMVYWDSNELKRRTCMSWGTIQDTFFFDERFPKVKLGGKWYYPAKETKDFLLMWLEERREVS
ncbi:group-specific protein [Halobacillus shinanisalinarum]|uniref:Group-specific protein n=1 Tax=Halobacillus shinanisalinarum TaxID=2932258 RepID=A0ABY4GZ47_9BACI|nr:group-specific protein [Halobacillus shinanisalinarum]UOQ93383.1 group-specific protein [Halobacillus shinanisalinarum]